jgi:hypothetical protein
MYMYICKYKCVHMYMYTYDIQECQESIFKVYICMCLSIYMYMYIYIYLYV